MSDPTGKVIDFDAPFGKRRTGFEAIAQAISENWRRFADEWSAREPQIDVDGWMRASAPDKLKWIAFSDEAKAAGAIDRGRSYLDAWFSPLSNYSMSMGVNQLRDGTLSISFTTDDKILNGPLGMREYRRMEEKRSKQNNNCRQEKNGLPPSHKTNCRPGTGAATNCFSPSR